MRRSRPARARLALLSGAATLCLLLAACEDPSGVGLTFVGGEENDPRAQTLRAESVTPTPVPDATGAFLTSSGFATFRVLAGSVADPLFGTTTANAYLDVLPPSSFPEDFRDRPVREATLRLVRSYAYGDTAAVTMLDIYQIEEEWSAVGATADTTFPVLDGVIASFEVSASDSLVEVPLPQSWIDANDEDLRDDDFATLFHGFRLSATTPEGAIYGFGSGSSLELISAEDTVRYQVSELFSNIVHEPAASFPGGFVPLQDGTSTGLGLAFVLDTLGTPALNTAFLRVNADTVVTQSGRPAGFVRPFADELALFGTVEDGDPVLLTTAGFDEETQSYTFRSSLVTSVLQELVLGREPVDGFAIGMPPSRTSVDAAALVAPPAEGGPRAILVLVPSQD